MKPVWTWPALVAGVTLSTAIQADPASRGHTAATNPGGRRSRASEPDLCPEARVSPVPAGRGNGGNRRNPGNRHR